MRILWLTSVIPYPPNAGTPIREYNLIKRIGKEHEVWLLTFMRDAEEKKYLQHLEEFCTHVFTVRSVFQRALSKPLQFFIYLLSGKPPDLRSYYYQEMADIIKGLLTTDTFDIFLIDDSFMAEYLKIVPENIHCKSVLSIIDIYYRRLSRTYQIEQKFTRKFRLWLFYVTMKRWEPKYLERFDHCLVMSEVDKNIMLSDNPKLKLSIVPNGVNSRFVNILPESKIVPSLLYVGNMEYRPNADAVEFFCNEVIPGLVEKYAGLDFWIVGKNPDDNVKRLQSSFVHVTGEVDSVTPYYEQCNICVVPLRAGGGTRLKILEAMSLGRPVVSTSVGCEGIDADDNVHIMIANSPTEFHEKIQRLLEDDVFRKQMIVNAKKLVDSKYDWDSIADKQIEIFKDLIN